MRIDLTKLKELREKAELTRVELADRIGCREHTIFRWEKGKTKNPLPIYKKALVNFYEEILLVK
jgi:DNA-binding XRE family transcriptional regulator